MPRKDKTSVVVYGGVEYAKYRGGAYYYNRKDQHAPRLHQQVYIDAHGSIPKGYHVHHIDGNTDNNDIDNLVAIPHGKHTKETFKQRWEHPVIRYCKLCGARFETISTRSEYCSKSCCHKSWVRRNKARLEYA